jgi:hypothetical protein
MSTDGPARRGLGQGAAQGAPTAPHATPHEGRSKRTGPERFWSRRSTQIAFGVALGLSLLTHGAALPFEWPAGLEVNDVEGEASIAVDLLQGSAADEPPPPPPIEAPAPGAAGRENPPVAVAAPTLPPDAGVNRARPSESRDASSDAPEDGSADGASGAPFAADAGFDAGAHDTEAIAGVAGRIQADVVLVVVLVNAEVIRKNPVGASLGALLRGIPQWEDFMSGTDIDPVRDTDWLMISGPSLVNTGRDVVLIRYAASDGVVDRAIARVGRKYAGGGPFDAGVPGVRATLAHADREERVLLRPGPHVLAVVPPSLAAKEARQLALLRLPAHVRPGEALYFRFETPHRAVPEIPESISELRLRVVPRADDGADAFLEGDTKDPESAALAAPEIAKIIRRRTGGFASLLLHGALDDVEVRSDGARVRVHVSVTLEQLETLASLAGALLGVPMPEVPAASSSPGSKPPSSVQSPRAP